MFGLSRTLAIVASVTIHAGVAVGVGLDGSAHRPAGREPADTATLEIDAAVTLDEPRPDVPPREPRNTGGAAVDHTHDYPVAATHAAHPHDPSRPHPRAVDAASSPPSASNAEPALPRFVISLGSPVRTVSASVPDSPSEAAGTPAASQAASGPGDAPLPDSVVDVRARLTSSVPAAYPPDARTDDIEGDVALEIVIDTEGRVLDARVVRPAGQGFDERAVEAVRRYRFSPARHGGKPVRVRMPWTVRFRLR